MKRQYDQGYSYKGRHLIRIGLQFSGLVQCHHGGKHGDIQADMVLKRQVRGLHPHWQAAGRDVLSLA